MTIICVVAGIEWGYFFPSATSAKIDEIYFLVLTFWCENVLFWVPLESIGTYCFCIIFYLQPNLCLVPKILGVNTTLWLLPEYDWVFGDIFFIWFVFSPGEGTLLDMLIILCVIEVLCLFGKKLSSNLGMEAWDFFFFLFYLICFLPKRRNHFGPVNYFMCYWRIVFIW